MSNNGEYSGGKSFLLEIMLENVDKNFNEINKKTIWLS